ncbi:hypothetical protein L195_g040402 [Trifolium pratense]|uniref:Uncharacterized protein n=2 Tax=Trifolium pratense TaxID=57577 RepID=A0ACB0JLU7_TRIPR|nr:hypothetical protein L195_g040402 [Trifolium pratense]CAJ2645245.1 unnamed protein product [Trifolium pratense]
MAGAADGFFRPIYEGSISGYDHSVERRPYHRKCGCVLHSKSRKSPCTHKLPIMTCNKIKYPMRRAWSESNLVLSVSPHSPLALGANSRRGSVDLDHDHIQEQQQPNKTSTFFEVNQSF